jgi:hypothetical protein
MPKEWPFGIGTSLAPATADGENIVHRIAQVGG